ncbi:MAG: hypothetical protein AABX47_09515 [Nanoarchaeota archaeon]
MNLRQIAAQIKNTRIENLESIARQITASSQTEYNNNYSIEIARQKLEGSGMRYHQHRPNSGFHYIIEENDGILVCVSAEMIIPDTRKSSLLNYTRKIKTHLGGHSGLIHFLPFQMNGKEVRAILERELDIALINLPYDRAALERRYRQHSTRSNPQDSLAPR